MGLYGLRIFRIVTVRLDERGATVEFDSGIDDTASAIAIVQRWLDLEADTTTIDEALSADPLLAPLIRRRPGLRLIGHPDEFEAVATTIIGQQVSLAAARTFGGRLVAAHGDPVGELRAFPDAETLARLGADRIQRCAGLTRTRARTLHEAAGRRPAAVRAGRRPGAKAAARHPRGRPLDRRLPAGARTAAPGHFRPR